MPQEIKKRVEELRTKNKSNNEIIDTLKKEGYSSRDIYNAIANEQIQPAGAELEPPSPSNQETETYTPAMEEFSPERIPKTIPSLPPRQSIEQLEELAESIVEEKWQETATELESFNLWKEKTTMEIEAIKQEVLRLRTSFENLQASVTGKVSEYGRGVSNLGAEMKALSKVLEKILEPLSSNVKELSKITETLKKK